MSLNTISFLKLSYSEDEFMEIRRGNDNFYNNGQSEEEDYNGFLRSEGHNSIKLL